MTMLKRIACLTLLAVVAACSDNTAPQVDGLSLARGGRWATTDAAATESSTTTPDSTDDVAVTIGCPYTDVPDGEPCVLRHAADAPPLATLSTSFEVVQGRRQKFDFAYATGEWYGGMVIPKDAQLLDESGRPLERGERVLVTVEFDPDRYLVRFGPHGSTFLGGRPTQLVFNTEYADFGNADPSRGGHLVSTQRRYGVGGALVHRRERG